LKSKVRDKSVHQLEVTGTAEFDHLKTISGVVGLSQTRHIETDTSTLKFVVIDESVVSEITSSIARVGSRVISTIRPEPTLEDVFIYLVGRGLQ
jgi:hypothetical protein